MLEKVFRLRENGTTVRTEVAAGITTFMTMSYIIFVNPSIVSETGMPFQAVLIATCLASAITCLLMAFLANYPFALAPGMGLNAYFTYSVVLGMGVPWQTALGAVFVSGAIFFVLSVSRVREHILHAIPESVRHGIAAGIGGFIALIGLQNAGIVVSNPATMVGLGSFRSPGTALAALGIVITGWLMARRVTGAILLGIVIVTVLGIPFGITSIPTAIIEVPTMSVWEPIFAKLDIMGALNLGLVTIVFAFLFVDMFDTLGTLTGVALQGGFLDDKGRLPRGHRAMYADSIGTMTGAVFGTPTVTTYIESATGVAAGGRTGLTTAVVALGFLVALFFGPVIGIVPAVATAPALVIVGSLMMGSVARIKWDDYTEAIPAFLALVGMPFTYSIANGIALGFVAYGALKLLSGRAREAHWIVYVLAVLFVVKFMLPG